MCGNATLKIYPELKNLKAIKESVDYIGTEVTASQSNQLNLINFIDTPGLIDSEMKYPFDINEMILSLASVSDLVFVFFDPVGLALCKRTLYIAEKINETHGNKIHFILAKADESGSDLDRQVARFIIFFVINFFQF